jgi:Family of unknown function (DUF6098)
VRQRLPVIHELGQLADVACGDGEKYLRYSAGPDADGQQTSRDYESGLTLPGLSVVPLTPPCWWGRPTVDWLARQISKYAHLGGEESDRCAWVLAGREVARGPDDEPLVADPRPLAILSTSVVEQARQHYHERFEVGRDSRS